MSREDEEARTCLLPSHACVVVDLSVSYPVPVHMYRFSAVFFHCSLEVENLRLGAELPSLHSIPVLARSR